MDKLDAETLVYLLSLLEADPNVPDHLRGSVAIVRGLALAAVALADKPAKVRLVV